MIATRSKTVSRRPTTNPILFEYPDDKNDEESYRSKITFTRHDQRKLQPHHFLNDTCISFFLQYYLDTKISPEVGSRTHVFDSYFFQKLQSIKQTSNDHATAYYCASRWLQGVKIFDKDFLILPVCEKDHWLLVIVCYPSRLPTRNYHAIRDEDLYEPVVLVLNSCFGLAPPIKRILSRYLKYQWHRERKTDRIFAIQNAKTSGIRLIFPELPQQKNSYDCGVYVINYFYCFLKDPRKAYISMFRMHSMKSWFRDNKIDISWERRRLASIVKDRISLWKGSRPGNKDGSQDDEIYIDSQSESPSCIDLVEEDSDIVDGKQIMVININ